MVSKEVTVRIIMDDSDAEAKVAKQQQAIDTQAADWRSKRNQILLEMHSINLGINLMVQSIRMAVRAAGQTLDPIQSALLSLISSTTSIMIATATALAAGSLGVLTGVALALAAFAWDFSLIQTVKVMRDYEYIKGNFASIEARLAEMEVVRFAAGRPF